jgi:hypothetical protein
MLVSEDLCVWSTGKVDLEQYAESSQGKRNEKVDANWWMASGWTGFEGLTFVIARAGV